MAPTESRNEQRRFAISAKPIHLLALAALAVICIALYLTDASAQAPAAQAKPDTYLKLTAKAWHTRAVGRTKERNRLRGDVRMLTRHIRHMRKAIVHRPSSLEAIRLASIAYKVDYGEMLAVASCESPGLSPTLKNPNSTASGLFQFLTSTYANTPYGRAGLSIWSPYANALAAGWLHRAAGWGPWVCRPR